MNSTSDPKSALAPRTVYVNGAYVPEHEAQISIFDRGFLFGDGVYEVSAVLDGKLVDNDAHLARLERSLSELSLPRPASDAEIVAAQRELIARNAVAQGLVYLQITRGAADRSFDWPDPEVTAPSLVMFTQSKTLLGPGIADRGIRVRTAPDIRWGRRDIKTVNLLPASWAKEMARRDGFDDAWLVEDGQITEGSSNNAFIVTPEGVLVTRQLGPELLPGITRRATLRLAAELQLKIEERPFTPDEARAAREAFSTSASAFVTPVVQIDGQPIGEGTPGPVARRLREVYIAEARATAQ